MSLLFSLFSGLRILRLEAGTQTLPTLIYLVPFRRGACCPLCQRPSRRVHSRYWRTLADLPCAEQSVCLKVQVRRFFCTNRRCTRRIFAERLPDLTKPYAQRTNRLKQAQTRVAQAVGSLPGARLAAHLRMPTSATTLLRLERAASVPTYATPRVLGVDDWAFRKGHRYGTILLDLEQHRVVDILPDRTSQSLATWLQEHTGVEIVSRDRAGAYAEGARQGAPQAIQVADRWHLVRNLGQALENLLDTRRLLLRQAVENASAVERAKEAVIDETLGESLPTSDEPAQKPPHVTRPEQLKQCHRQERLDRYLEVQQLYRQGLKVSGISRQMHLDPKTVRKYLRAKTFIDRKERAPQKRGRMVDSYAAYLRQRWDSGCHNVAQLYRELTEQGYHGCYTSVKDYIKVWRQSGLAGAQKRPPRVSPRQVAYWILRKAETVQLGSKVFWSNWAACVSRSVLLGSWPNGFWPLSVRRRERSRVRSFVLG